MERSHSGLVHRSRKPECLNGYRGFKSHPLRHFDFGFWIADFGLKKFAVCLMNMFFFRKGARAVELATLEM